jgi:hypothetical protein
MVRPGGIEPKIEAMSRPTRNWKADVEAIRRILISEWDPIGFGVPEDEYDSYIPTIYLLMQSCVGIEGLASHLEKLETVSMGLSVNTERNRRVAKMLLDLMD